MASDYNSRYHPAEVLWHNGEAYLIRQGETFEDLLRKSGGFEVLMRFWQEDNSPA